MGKIKLVVFWFFSALTLSACVGSVPYKNSQNQTIPKAPSDKAQIVFLRSSSTFAGGKIPAVLFDVSGEKEVVIGAIPNRTKLVHLAEPGNHYFMVHSNEAADFLAAELLPGKTYYVLVRPFPGAATYRFSFAPFRNSSSDEFSLQSNRFKEWLNSTTVVEPTDETYVWYQNNSVDVKTKREKYWPVWSDKSEAQRDSQTMNKNDGV
ncbi:hypothetical protein [Teredinibacter sp. KSP-S5-2]|uniref:hypothetical protein n=1 Tax=Teredinibacter sp. KSP-S5-2 TaxID=3034506 RepID=UPI002935074C|nr:hypothetical protein [Teredinibacter sp. KSP-S5-2]WNO10634.1 hypothetical protein P5V12_05550 [Teredinibacter sp. KSP-S5-2]